MSEETKIQWVRIAEIDPESSVNVRQSGVDENRALLAESIRASGYHEENPVLLRPHPRGPDHEYQYECVSGRSRFLGAGDAGMEAVPMVIREMSDEEAIQRSYAENSQRTNISTADKVRCFTAQFKRFRNAGHDTKQAREQTARFFNAKPADVKTYLLLTHLPEDLQDRVDSGLLPERLAKAIATRYEGIDEQSRDDAMREAADWALSLSDEDRRKAEKAISKTPLPADPAELQKTLDLLKIDEARGPVTLRCNIPATTNRDLLELAEKRGFTSAEAFLPMLIGDAVNASDG